MTTSSTSPQEYLLSKSLPILNQLSAQDRGILGTFQMLGPHAERYAVEFAFTGQWEIASLRKLS